MVVLSQKDFLDVKMMSLIAEYDKETLANLYQPVIGFTAFALYLTLLSEANNQKVSSFSSHSTIFARMKIQTGEFIDARKALEAVGLLKTYLEKAGETKFYHYQLFSPKTPKKFFDDALLYGLLIKEVGDQEANKLKSIYKVNISEETGEEISASFAEVFRPDFDDPVFMAALENKPSSLGRRTAHIISEFNYEKFFESLMKISQLTENSFNKKDMKEIERLAMLNDIDEETAAKLIITKYDAHQAKGKRVDYKELARLFQEEMNYSTLSYKNKRKETNTNSGSTALASKINLMETLSPKRFLSAIANGTKPASSDLRLVDDLSKNYNLPNSVINPLIDFVLSTNNNVFSRSLTEKIAASLAREGITTTIDTMEFLNKTSSKSSSKIPFNKYSKKVEEIETPKQENKSQDEEEFNWEEMLLDLDEGNADGKA
jgi:replication initiation and membrane attachment protein